MGNYICGKWYAIKTLSKGVWTIGTFGEMIYKTHKDKYLNKDKYVILGGFMSCKAAEIEVENYKNKESENE